MRLKQALTRKFGPLPAWAWLGAIAGAIIFYRSYVSRGSDTSTVDASGADTSSYGAAGSDVGNGGGAGGGYGSGGLPLDQAQPVQQAGELYPDNKLHNTVMELIDTLRGYTGDIADAVGPADSSLTPKVGPGRTTQITDASGRVPGQGGATSVTTRPRVVVPRPDKLRSRRFRHRTLAPVSRGGTARSGGTPASAAVTASVAGRVVSTSGRETVRAVSPLATHTGPARTATTGVLSRAPAGAQ